MRARAATQELMEGEKHAESRRQQRPLTCGRPTWVLWMSSLYFWALGTDLRKNGVACRGPTACSGGALPRCAPREQNVAVELCLFGTCTSGVGASGVSGGRKGGGGGQGLVARRRLATRYVTEWRR